LVLVLLMLMMLLQFLLLLFMLLLLILVFGQRWAHKTVVRLPRIDKLGWSFQQNGSRRRQGAIRLGISLSIIFLGFYKVNWGNYLTELAS